MSERSKISIKTGSAARDPRRRPVRGGRSPLPPERPSDSRPPAKRPSPPHRARAPLRELAPAVLQDQQQVKVVQPTAQTAAVAAGIRLSKWMSDRSLASRREADDWIAAGWVRVDGEPAVLGQRVHGHELIEIDDAARHLQKRSVTILLNKPIGYVSGQAEDGHEPASVLITAANRWGEDRGLAWNGSFVRGLAPAGRLDIDSTGLLVLTQDGRVARHLIGEDSDVEKEYLVRVQPVREGAFNPDDIERLRHGLELDGVRLKPAKVSWANEDQLRVVLREGRKRQIRRMCELVGLKVVGLKRVRIGSVVLGKLPAGQWRLLRDDERF